MAQATVERQGVRISLDHKAVGSWRWDVVSPGDATDHRPHSVAHGYARTMDAADWAAMVAWVATDLPAPVRP